MNIFLCCSAGMSTSMLVNKMKQAAEQQGLTCQINAYSITEFEERLSQNDVCLVAPQVKFKFEQFKQRAEEEGKACGLIEMLDYGMMKGDVILEQALKLYQSLK
ncbi:PTS system cellobiose-specific IIB component [Vibrio sp. ES.051]|uniref:PTS sugar transporter subunit IIB n=1 Tax=Vibrio sp. ES.051 TaxID=1761909 RepID=UPI000BF86C9D|nr:PTS sugar transporter subunit IIB [Vibrio sp. ES.051]PFG58351.1 PTS system cellobiose-specific IIB component [Vibrio sp. ES.051]